MRIRKVQQGLRLGKPNIEVNHSKRTERLDGKVREGETVADYQRRVFGQIESLD